MVNQKAEIVEVDKKEQDPTLYCLKEIHFINSEVC